jgi:hypothetical protein
MITQIYVTEGDIEKAKRFSTSHNPINLAIKRIYTLDWKLAVFPDRIICTRKGFRQRTIHFSPESKIPKFLLAFHSGEKVKSFREQINLPG